MKAVYAGSFDPITNGHVWMVQRAYGGEGRKYHDLFHVEAVVRRCRELAEAAGRGEGWCELEAGLWFHDAVYDAKRPDNEAESARWARKALCELGLPAERAERIAGIVRATRHDGSAATEMERLACDIDLLSLAESEATFRRHTAAIRQEYGHVSDEDFRHGRLAFLEKMLSKGRTYHGDDFERRYGPAAARNMRASAERLRRGEQA